MDLETEAKLTFLNHEEPRAWFLTDLENGTVIQLSQTAKPKDYIYNVAYCILCGWIKGFNGSITTILYEVGSYRNAVG